jgi:hypothetical protein
MPSGVMYVSHDTNVVDTSDLESSFLSQPVLGREFNECRNRFGNEVYRWYAYDPLRGHHHSPFNLVTLNTLTRLISNTHVNLEMNTSASFGTGSTVSPFRTP